MFPNNAMLKPTLAYAVTNFLDVFFGDSHYLFLSSTRQKND
jgi:hypothetical protein